jgi:hypothetical protein
MQGLYELPIFLKHGGLDVVVEPGWKTSGHGPMDPVNVKGVLCHHTAGPKSGDAPSLPVVVNGRPDLAGPLAQLFLSRSGVWHVVTVFKAWHAGAGAPGTKWEHFDGNVHLIGIEAENTGLGDDPWPEQQLESYARGVAVLLSRYRCPLEMCLGHKEYAVGRKTDPSFSMDDFRRRVSSHIGGGLVA